MCAYMLNSTACPNPKRPYSKAVSTKHLHLLVPPKV